MRKKRKKKGPHHSTKKCLPLRENLKSVKSLLLENQMASETFTMAPLCVVVCEEIRTRTLLISKNRLMKAPSVSGPRERKDERKKEFHFFLIESITVSVCPVKRIYE